MITVMKNPNLRERFILSPWFQCLNRAIVLQIDKLVEVFNPEAGESVGAWEELNKAHEAWAYTINEKTFINPNTLEIVPEETDGAIPVLGLMVQATARQIGLEDLDQGSIYDAMATMLEQFVTINKII